MFTSQDIAALRSRGISESEARRQVALLSRPPAYAVLDRPCTIGDGIGAVPDEDLASLYGLHREAADEGRCSKFVPASGAASRMFGDLLHYRNAASPPDAAVLEADIRSGSREARALRTFIESVHDFAFAGDLARAVGRAGGDLDRLVGSGRYGPVLEGLLSEDGLDCSRLPKGLIPFHAYADGSRTPFEEHLVEAADVVRDREGRCRVHLTVSAEHLDSFESALRRARARHEERLGIRFEVTLSVQKPSTDTLALDEDGRPFRTDGGTLLLRPAGHGALLSNLGGIGADVVLVRNIDNVVPDRLKPIVCKASRAISGLLLRARKEIFEHLRKLEEGSDRGAPAEAAALLRRLMHRQAVPDREALIVELDRPLRVCGMVRNTGDPGGGPFWTRGPRGEVSIQIVEGAQVDPASEEQGKLYASATHINPVFMALGLRDHRDEPFDLDRFVDEDAVIVARKSHEGRKLIGLERPGLWNGSMARWNTIFVEVPLEVFNPVKTVNDLLREPHRSA